MIVSELIDKLKGFPADAPVVYSRYSDFEEMNIDQVKLYTAESKQMVLRGGNYASTYPSQQWGDEIPVYVTVVHFPGN